MHRLQLWSKSVLNSNDIRPSSAAPALDGPDHISQSVINQHIPSHRSRNRGLIRNGGMQDVAAAGLSWITRACGRPLSERLPRHGSICRGRNLRSSGSHLLVGRSYASESDGYACFACASASPCRPIAPCAHARRSTRLGAGSGIDCGSGSGAAPLDRPGEPGA